MKEAKSVSETPFAKTIFRQQSKYILNKNGKSNSGYIHTHTKDLNKTKNDN